MKLVIFGQPRSGTTALFTRICGALPQRPRMVFEPQVYRATPEDATHDVVVKMLVGSLPGDAVATYASCQAFDHTILLLRDPRDRLVSGLLFLLHWSNETHPPFSQQNPTGFQALMDLLRKKEHHPSAMPTRCLFELLFLWRFGCAAATTWAWYAAQQHQFFALHATIPGALTVRYEAMEGMYGTLDALEAQIGFSLPMVPVLDEYRSIFRAGRSGFWRHWFTPDDVTYFAPLMRDYLTHYGYGEDWTLAEPQMINPRTSSQYVRKWDRVKRRQRHVSA